MLRRRLATVPGVFIAWALWLAATPIWLLVAAAVDLVRRRRGVTLRSGALVAVYLCCEIAGVVASGALWSWRAIAGIDPERWTDLHFRLEAWWGATLFRALVRLFALRVEVEGDAGLARGPYLLLLRHASAADTLLASGLISRPHRVRLRYVLKRELLWDPCLDIVGHRLPNVFVDRATDDSQAEIQRVRELARRLGPRDGVLIYPEGTRFSEAKRRQLLARLHAKGDTKMLEYARSLGSVLPPRPGGTLGLLDEARDSDVIICAHTGFEDAASFARFWYGSLVGRVIRVQFQRVPRDRIPDGRDARSAWLLEEWRRVDSWVESRRHS
jgi:1-acyl-sn-glycerol-3-phosphate acyltransferase